MQNPHRETLDRLTELKLQLLSEFSDEIKGIKLDTELSTSTFKPGDTVVDTVTGEKGVVIKNVRGYTELPITKPKTG